MTDTAKQRILLIEDDDTLSRSLETLLTDAGFEVAIARDGEEGVQLAEASAPDLILSDVMLPKLEGTAAVKRIRAMPALADVPVIMLTNRDDLETIGDSMANGSFDFLVKHEWRLEDIVKRVQERLEVSKE